MNNSLERLLDGIAATLRHDVIPGLADEFAAGQALAAIDLLNNLKPRLDWAVPPLRERAHAQRSLVAELEHLLAGYADRPRAVEWLAELPGDGRGLHALCDRLDNHIGAMVRWLERRRDVQGPSIDVPILDTPSVDEPSIDAAIEAARAAISRHIHDELRRDIALTARPLFAEISRGGDPTASAPESAPLQTTATPAISPPSPS